MFGTLSPRSCALIEEDRRGYQRFYCGLCQTLGERYGQLSRPLVGNDAVFLALLGDALAGQEAGRSACRCPMLPVVVRPTVSPGSVSMRFAVACQMLLGDQWLADRAVEGKRLARLLRPLARSYVERAHRELADLGVSFRALDGFAEEQARVERAARRARGAEAAIVSASAPTERALGLVFGALGDLPGMDVGPARALLVALGAALGRVIYLTDALLDAEGDAKSGAFNPLVRRGRLRADRVAHAARLLEEALVKVRSIRGVLPIRRHGAILDAVLTTRLPEQAARAAEDARAALRRTAGPSRTPRWVAPWVWLLTALVAWLGQLRDARATPSRAGAAPPRGLPRLAARAPAAPTARPRTDGPPRPTNRPIALPSTPPVPPAPPANDNGGPSATPSAAPSATPSAAPSATPSAAPGAAPSASGSPGSHGPGAPACTVCSDACQSCGQACGDACNGCKGCCNPCGGCVDSCHKSCETCRSGCDGKCCGDCLSPCKACGDCRCCDGKCCDCGGCKGCGDCCSGCR